MSHRSQAPENDGERESFIDTESVDDAADQQQTQGVSDLKRKNDVAVVDLASNRTLLEASGFRRPIT